MSGDMDPRNRLVDHLRPEPEKIVHRPGNELLIARDWVCRNDHSIAGDDLHLSVIGIGDTGQGGHRLALTPGSEQNELFQGDSVDLIQLHDDRIGQVEITEFGGDPHRVYEAAAGDADLAAVAVRRGDHLLDPVDIGGEGGEDDPVLCQAEDIVDGIPHFPFRCGEPRPVRIGGIDEGEEHTAAAQLGELEKVGELAVYGGMIELEITRVDHGSFGGMQGEAHCTGDAVVCPEKFKLKAAPSLSTCPARSHVLYRRVGLVFFQLG